MKTRLLPVVLATLALGLSRPLFAADDPNGYKVVLELQVDEKGAVEDAKVDTSDDTSPNRVLDRTSMEKARGMKLEPRLKNGQPVKYTVKAPFVYQVQDDEGPAANAGLTKPIIRTAVRPGYPAELAAKAEVGGAILEIVIGTGGNVKSVTVLRSSHPAFAAQATAAVNQWYFIPAMKDGAPVESRWRLSIGFATDVVMPDWQWQFAPRPSLGNYIMTHPTLPLPPKAPATTVPPAPDGK